MPTKTRLTVICLLLAILVTPSTAHGGCFRPEKVIPLYITLGKPACLWVAVGPACAHDVSLRMRNFCGDTILYQRKGSIYIHELITNRPVSEYYKLQKTNLNVRLNIEDSSVPQGRAIWMKSVYFKDDPGEKITIWVINIALIDMFVAIGIAVPLAILVYIFRKKSRRRKTMRQNHQESSPL